MNEQTNELKEVLDIKFEMVLKRGLYEKSVGCVMRFQENVGISFLGKERVQIQLDSLLRENNVKLWSPPLCSLIMVDIFEDKPFIL